MASPQELNLLAHDTAACKPGAPDLTAQGSFAKAEGDERLPVVAAAANGEGEGTTAKPGATAKASLVHETGLKHPIVEVMVTSHNGARLLLRRRPADDPLAPDTWDATATAHLLPEDGGDAHSAALRALENAGLTAIEADLKPLPERRDERLEFPVGSFVENVVVHGFTLALEAEAAATEPAGTLKAATTTKGPDGAERTWVAKEDALRMMNADPGVCSPYLVAGKKAWFSAAC